MTTGNKWDLKQAAVQNWHNTTGMKESVFIPFALTVIAAVLKIFFKSKTKENDTIQNNPCVFKCKILKQNRILSEVFFKQTELFQKVSY